MTFSSSVHKRIMTKKVNWQLESFAENECWYGYTQAQRCGHKPITKQELFEREALAHECGSFYALGSGNGRSVQLAKMGKSCISTNSDRSLGEGIDRNRMDTVQNKVTDHYDALW